MAISKIILNGVTQIDLTSDTVAAANLIAPNTAHGADGEPVVGTVSTGSSGTITIEEIPNATGTTLQITTNGSGGGGDSDTWETLIDQQVEVLQGSPNYFSIYNTTDTIDAHEQYRVTWGNATHVYTTAQSQDGYYFGNPSADGGVDDGSGISLIIYRLNSSTLVGQTLDNTGNKYLKIEKKVSGGSTPSATQHDIYFEFSDETNTTITAYYDDSFISNAITATTPTTYGNKTVTLAQLDSVTWYEPASIPLNTQLIDFTSVQTGYTIDDNGDIISSEAWNCVTDYTAIESTMTFSFMCEQYANIGFYDSGKNAIRTVQADSIKDSAEDYVASGSLTPSIIPANARYVVMVGNSYGPSATLSLIRTA